MDPYLLLGVTSDTPLCQITQTYRQMARLVHPDSNQMKWSEEECEDAFIKIKLAFDHILEEKKGEQDMPDIDICYDPELANPILEGTDSLRVNFNNEEFLKLFELNRQIPSEEGCFDPTSRNLESGRGEIIIAQEGEPTFFFQLGADQPVDYTVKVDKNLTGLDLAAAYTPDNYEVESEFLPTNPKNREDIPLDELFEQELSTRELIEPLTEQELKEMERLTAIKNKREKERVNRQLQKDRDRLRLN
tara:strand:- start:67 stop:807 length:741 start_codon:yes stop_codon:yes gene_type:complete